MNRAKIFANIKQLLVGNQSDSLSDKKRLELVLDRIKSDPKHTIPARSIAEPEELVSRFINRATIAGTIVVQCPSFQDAVDSIVGWLDKNNFSKLRCDTSTIIKDLIWPSTSKISFETGTLKVADKVTLTGAFSAIAETGTLMVISSVETPTLLAFLPDNHLVIIKRSHIVGPYEQAWEKLQKQFPEKLPRNVNLITGPSRSADIEQTLLMGAHGPKELVIFLVDE